jgi:hypothetical protein
MPWCQLDHVVNIPSADRSSSTPSALNLSAATSQSLPSSITNVNRTASTSIRPNGRHGTAQDVIFWGLLLRSFAFCYMEIARSSQHRGIGSACLGCARDQRQTVIDTLQNYSCLDDFLCKAPNSAMLWFFQQRDAFLSQERMTKWSRDALDDYVLLLATSNFVSRNDCFYVSHFWRTQEHPDPDSEHLRRFQAELQPQHWSYIWVDWTCIPQSPHSQAEEAYFL